MKKILICIVVIALGIGSRFYYDKTQRFSVATYLKTKEIKKLNRISNQELLWLNQKCFEHYQSYTYGNKEEILEANGKVYKDNKVYAFINDKGLFINNKLITKDSASFINYYNDSIYFRNDIDRDIYRYSIKDNKLTKELAGNYTQLKIVNGVLYFINFNDNCLYNYKTKSKKTQKISNLKIKKFTVVGNDYLVLTTNNYLKLTNGSKAKFSVSGINDYFYNGNLVTLTEDKIMQWKDTKSPKKMINEDFNHIIGINGNTLYLDELFPNSTDIISVDFNNYSYKKCQTINSMIIITSYVNNDDIKYLEYSLVDENNKKYYVIE